MVGSTFAKGKKEKRSHRIRFQQLFPLHCAFSAFASLPVSCWEKRYSSHPHWIALLFEYDKETKRKSYSMCVSFWGFCFYVVVHWFSRHLVLALFCDHVPFLALHTFVVFISLLFLHFSVLPRIKICNLYVKGRLLFPSLTPFVFSWGSNVRDVKKGQFYRFRCFFRNTIVLIERQKPQMSILARAVVPLRSSLLLEILAFWIFVQKNISLLFFASSFSITSIQYLQILDSNGNFRLVFSTFISCCSCENACIQICYFMAKKMGVGYIRFRSTCN